MSTATLRAALAAHIDAAIARHIFPGAVVLVARAGELLHCAAYGRSTYAADAPPISCATIYDIASITKMFTATAALHLVDAGALHLDTPATHYLPALRAHTVTVRHLLTHTSGLELRLSSLRDYAPAALRQVVYDVAPTPLPGSRTAYVNISTLLLGDVVTAVAGQPLDEVISRTILEPLSLQHTMFCPPAALHPYIPPTEWDDWRGGPVQGSVHDESAHALGGVAGHAGLFSTAHDLWRFGQMWLNGGTLDGRRVLRAKTAALATSYQGPHLGVTPPAGTIRCGLGWMLDRPEVMGDAPAGSYGHTGFTGPVLLVIPQHRLVLVVLNNRTYPRRGARDHLAVVAALVNTLLREAV